VARQSGGHFALKWAEKRSASASPPSINHWPTVNGAQFVFIVAGRRCACLCSRTSGARRKGLRGAKSRAEERPGCVGRPWTLHAITGEKQRAQISCIVFRWRRSAGDCGWLVWTLAVGRRRAQLSRVPSGQEIGADSSAFKLSVCACGACVCACVRGPQDAEGAEEAEVCPQEGALLVSLAAQWESALQKRSGKAQWKSAVEKRTRKAVARNWRT